MIKTLVRFNAHVVFVEPVSMTASYGLLLGGWRNWLAKFHSGDIAVLYGACPKSEPSAFAPLQTWFDSLSS